MYNLLIWFSDKTYYEMNNVLRIEYFDVLGDSILVSEDELLTHRFPTTRELHFFSGNESYTTAGKTIKSIQITKKS